MLCALLNGAHQLAIHGPRGSQATLSPTTPDNLYMFDDPETAGPPLQLITLMGKKSKYIFASLIEWFYRVKYRVIL